MLRNREKMTHCKVLTEPMLLAFIKIGNEHTTIVKKGQEDSIVVNYFSKFTNYLHGLSSR